MPILTTIVILVIACYRFYVSDRRRHGRLSNRELQVLRLLACGAVTLKQLQHDIFFLGLNGLLRDLEAAGYVGRIQDHYYVKQFGRNLLQESALRRLKKTV